MLKREEEALLILDAWGEVKEVLIVIGYSFSPKQLKVSISPFNTGYPPRRFAYTTSRTHHELNLHNRHSQAYGGLGMDLLPIQYKSAHRIHPISLPFIAL